jgi:Rrf2 family nitric oxide-sensitive transcriptional repressor
MRLLASTDFALRCLMVLAESPDHHLNTEEMARRLKISRHHLQKVVQDLAQGGFVETIRGAKGGVMLAKPAGEIQIGAVVRWFETDQAVVECFRADGGRCTLTPSCRLRGMLAGAEEGFLRHLDRFSLAACCDKAALRS